MYTSAFVILTGALDKINGFFGKNNGCFGYRFSKKLGLLKNRQTRPLLNIGTFQKSPNMACPKNWDQAGFMGHSAVPILSEIVYSQKNRSVPKKYRSVPN